jgi:protein-histidine N-methyltransferase
VIQADIVQIPQVADTIYKRTLEDVKFQMAEQDMLGEVEDKANTEVANMLNLSGNTDLIKGVYEGGFKTWECSIDMVQYLASLPEDQITNKRVLEVKGIHYIKIIEEETNIIFVYFLLQAWLWLFTSFSLFVKAS